ncbi:hypothetical protein [Vibrio owensii]|uniref:hypothetical protein n=1 Tax=Vibrio owensii TaxID=696485 RepID=UPI0018F17A84|nr:hypothetical protein [Vibrio owensii]
MEVLGIIYLVIYRMVVELGVLVHGESTRDYGSWHDYAAMLTVMFALLLVVLLAWGVVKLLQSYGVIGELE